MNSAEIFCILGIGLVSCSASMQSTEAKVLDIADADCKEVEQQDPTNPYVDFTCTVLDVATGVTKTFQAHVKKTDAAMLAARKCPDAGKVAP